jgi:hypothetical protein
MAIAVSLDPAFTTTLSGAGLATAAFSPVANSLIMVVASTDSATGAITCAFTNSAGLTFTKVGTEQVGSSGGTVCLAWAFTVSAQTNMTVTSTWTGTGTSGGKGIKPTTFTGTLSSGVIGAVSQANSTTNDFTASYTNTANQSVGFGGGTEWNALGLPTSTDTEQAYHLASTVDGISLFKAAATSGTGVTVNGDYDAGGTGAALWSTIWCEIKAATVAAVSDVPDQRRALRYRIAR